MEDGQLAAIHKSIVDLHVGQASTHQKLVDVADQLDRHMREEHDEFRKALLKVGEVERAVHEIHTVARFTRALAAIGAGLAGIAAASWEWMRK